MKITFVALLFATFLIAQAPLGIAAWSTGALLPAAQVSAFLQDPTASAIAACGLKTASVDVELHDVGSASLPPESGKSRVYFIQEMGRVINVGVDGAWVGANKDNSYFSMPVGPGEHHVCVSVQSRFSEGRLLALAHFTAETGGAFYFRIRLVDQMDARYAGPPLLEIFPIDSDEGKYLIATSPLSVSHPKK